MFVSVEDGLEEYVFSTLRAKYAGNPMVNPNIDDFYRYRIEDMIVINKLPTESLKVNTCFWNTRIEKILVYSDRQTYDINDTRKRICKYL